MIVKLILEFDTLRDSATLLSAGRYVLLESGENRDPMVVITTMRTFVLEEKIEYGRPESGYAARISTSADSEDDVSSYSCQLSIWI